MGEVTLAARRQARWVAVLYAADFALQRFAVPGVDVPVTLPLACGWLAAGLARTVLEIDRRRMVLWLGAGAVTALLTVPQVLWTPFPIISLSSWGLWMVVWLPVTVRFVDRSPQAHRQTLRAVAHVGLGLSTLSIAFLVTQLAGFRYRDWLAESLPPGLVLQGYVTTYPLTYGSPLFKPNGWLGLEPSFLSFMLGVCTVASIITGQHVLKVTWLALGLVATTAGSGIFVVVVFVAAAVVLGHGRLLLRYLIPTVVVGVVVSFTTLGPYLLGRATELNQPRSSTSLRLTDPYLQLWPDWTADPLITIIGRGAGSSQRLISDLAITGLLVPTPAKLLFDYGIIGGGLLLIVIVVCYLRSPMPALALALAASMLTIQSASQPLVVCTFLVVSLFAPFTRPEHGTAPPPSRDAQPAIGRRTEAR